jgi:uncharacterized damage-inducible protein DinB
MPQKTPWIERHFTFDMPVSMFPNVLERLRGTPARVEERIRGLTAAVARKKREGKWSIQETVGHLIEVEALWLGRMEDFAAGREILRPADMSNKSTEAADYNAKNLAEVLSGFRKVRSRFVEELERLDDRAIERTALHPRLNQPMRILDMMVFVAEHDDHHLARITELLRAFASSGPRAK